MFAHPHPPLKLLELTKEFAEASSYTDVLSDRKLKASPNIAPPQASPPNTFQRFRYFMVGMMMPRSMIFWQKRKTMSVGMLASTRPAMVIQG